MDSAVASTTQKGLGSSQTCGQTDKGTCAKKPTPNEVKAMIERTFQDIRDGDISHADQQSFLVSMGWSNGTKWEDLLRSKRILIISEAGSGKTHECRNQSIHLRNSGEPAFFVELATLASHDLRRALDDEEEALLDNWLSSQYGIATFFLDSIDELKLSRGSFEQALKNLKKGIGSNLNRIRVIITTRPIVFDEQVFRRLLPVPEMTTAATHEDTFVKIAMRSHYDQQPKTEPSESACDWRTVALMPLSNAQIIEFSITQGVNDPQVLLNDIEKRNAQEFARRPQDLIELCADWRENKRIRTHKEQIKTNIRIKLQARDDRPEPAELSVEKAIEGASRLALAMLVTRRLTIRHSAESDKCGSDPALDPAIILSDWNQNERKALLERPLFGFSSYGRVRFHHRSVAEYLAAERLNALCKRGMPFRALKRLLFAETKGKIIVRPSKRPVAGWMALANTQIFETLRDNEPSVLLDEGDPESLSPIQRAQALQAYVLRHGQGGWRGLTVPHIQIHRFASPDLASEITNLWKGGIENPDVRKTLIALIEMGHITECADIVRRLAHSTETSADERIDALDAMLAINDPQLQDIAHAVTSNSPPWSGRVAHNAILRMFPKHLPIDQLCQALCHSIDTKRSIGDLSYQLPYLISNMEVNQENLEELRNGLVNLISKGLRWDDKWPHIISDRQNLSSSLAATCVRGLCVSKNDEWLNASVLALRLQPRDHYTGDAIKELKNKLSNLDAHENSRLFWAEDSLIQPLHPITDPWLRLAEIISSDSPVRLDFNRDFIWIKESLQDTHFSIIDRSMLLEAAMRIYSNQESWENHISKLKPLVADMPELIATIDNALKPSKHKIMAERWEKQQAKRKKQSERRIAKNKASWIQFRQLVIKKPEQAFSDGNKINTAYDLWKVMRRTSANGNITEWNRPFIEEQFGASIANTLKSTLMDMWRQDVPTLSSERPEDQRNTFLIIWQLGLAGIYAEAEDPLWATKLTTEEAKLAARYAPIELNGFPRWMESLINAHAASIDEILGKEFSWELSTLLGPSILLQDISYASKDIAIKFIPRLFEWINSSKNIDTDTEKGSGHIQRLRQAIDILLKHGSDDIRKKLMDSAKNILSKDISNDLIVIWLSTLIKINPESGVEKLEEIVQVIDPGQYTEAVTLFGVLFGDRNDAINLKDPAITPPLLLKLLRLAYQHIKPCDDIEREGSYRCTRDQAQRARNIIVDALLDMNGELGFAAKIEMASDPTCVHFRDRIIALAEEHWAQEIDSSVLDHAQAAALDTTYEAPASTNEAMFSIMNDRLADLDDLLLCDTSPKEAWAGITQERVMRREIARVLDNSSNGLYRVSQESTTAEEKETDIRLISVASDHEAVIELKLANNWTATQLLKTINEQLVKKYMAPEHRRSGCLLITLSKDKTWEHPDSEKRIGLDELTMLLREEAKRIESVMMGAMSLTIHVLDLRPRLPKGKSKKSKQENITEQAPTS